MFRTCFGQMHSRNGFYRMARGATLVEITILYISVDLQRFQSLNSRAGYDTPRKTPQGFVSPLEVGRWSGATPPVFGALSHHAGWSTVSHSGVYLILQCKQPPSQAQDGLLL